MLKHYLSFSALAFISFLHLTVVLKMLLQYQNLTVPSLLLFSNPFAVIVFLLYLLSLCFFIICILLQKDTLLNLLPGQQSKIKALEGIPWKMVTKQKTKKTKKKNFKKKSLEMVSTNDTR